jgi:NADH:ubiquinone oxidoreductase subunit 3 (subunit A)
MHNGIEAIFFSEYKNIFIFFIVAFIITLVIFSISFFFVPRSPELQKISAYECGFDPFGDARSRFNVRFYLVAILFIIFDLEIMYLFPWVLVLNRIGFFGFVTMGLFLFILTIGFAYEWIRGALDWE